jgi:hypothetical protein
MEDLRLQLVDLVGQLSLLAWDSKQHLPDKRPQPQSIAGRQGLEAALAALRPAPIAATAPIQAELVADDNTLAGVISFSQQEAATAPIQAELVADDNTLTGVISFSQQEADQEMSPQERWSKRVREHLFSQQEAEQQSIQQRLSKHVEEHLSR